MPDLRMNPPLRILHLTAGSDAGGLSRYIFDLCDAMTKLGHEVYVAGEHGAWRWLFERAPWPWIDVPLKGGLGNMAIATATLQAFLKHHAIDLIHTHYRRPTLVARRIQKTHKLPILYTLHLSHLSLRWPMRWFSDWGDRTHVASDEARQWLIDEARLAPDRINVIPHGVMPERFPKVDEISRAKARLALGIHQNARVAAFVGRLDDPKNEGWMLDLASAAQDKIPNLVVLLAGEGPHEAFLKKRTELGEFGDRVKLLGHREPLAVYHAADALLLPSSREGFSLVTAEAMCAGLPVLRTRTSGTSGLVLENITGRSVEIDHDAFITTSIEFLRDDASLQRMGVAAADHVRANFTFDRQLEDTLMLYRKMLKR